MRSIYVDKYSPRALLTKTSTPANGHKTGAKAIKVIMQT